MTKDELEMFDILKKEKMTKEDEIKIKNAAKKLLKRLLEERPKVLVMDWFKDSQSQARVRSAIEDVLDHELPVSYDKPMFRDRCSKVYGLLVNNAYQGLRWAAA